MKVAAYLLLGFLAPPAFAQAQPERVRPREEAFKMVDAYIVSNLQESLGLTDEQFVKVLPLVRRLQSDRRSMIQKRQQSLQELRRLLRSGQATDGRVAGLMRELRSVEADEPARLRKDIEAVDAVLTPIQQAKYRVLEVEVEQKIRELMNQLQGQGRPGPRQRRGGAPPEPPQ